MIDNSTMSSGSQYTIEHRLVAIEQTADFGSRQQTILVIRDKLI